MKVYVLCDLDYEWQEVHGVFSTRQKAESAAAQIEGRHDWIIREYELDLPGFGT